MQFIGHEITVTLPSGFSLEKKPPVPESFQWQGKLHTVTEMLAMWHRYGKPEIRMQGGGHPTLFAAAARRARGVRAGSITAYGRITGGCLISTTTARPRVSAAPAPGYCGGSFPPMR